MLGYVVRRLLSSVLVLFAITMVTFLSFRTTPDNPACLVVDCTQQVSKAELKAVDHKLGVDRPVYVQYAHFVWRMLRHGSFGKSWLGMPIDAMIRLALPQTASIVLGGLAVLLLLALPLGVLSALRSETLIDRAVLIVSILGIALHPLVVGYLLRLFFSTKLHLLPPNGYCKIHGPHPAYNFAGPQGFVQISGCGNGVTAWAKHLVLPWFTFAMFFLPLYVRMIRAHVIETLNQPHVATARAKGASELKVIRAHVLRIAMLPVATMLALDLGGALMASIYIEVSYNFNGIGSLMLNLLAGNHVSFDVPMIAALFFLIGGVVIAVNLVADLVHASLDPRIRLGA
jgi:peptide/nickel transport system permease protein